MPFQRQLYHFLFAIKKASWRLKMKSDNDQASPDTSQYKNPYEQPQLQVYGDLRNITQSMGKKGAKDGGGPPTDKTHS